MTPPQEYSPPELRGVQGRYVRIRPSITHGDGYLSISQIQVIDINDINQALGANVFATSSGGSPLDQQYGKEVKNGGVYDLMPGIGADPSCVTDGTLAPRRSLANTFETANQNFCPLNTSAPDTEYLEIDLSGQYIIKKIIYTGRADPIRGTFGTFEGTETIDQVSRLTNMRLEIYDSNRNIVIGPGNTYNLFSDNLATHQTVIDITMPLVTINSGGGSGLQTVSIPDLTAYNKFVEPFQKYPLINNKSNQSLMDAFNTLYSSLTTTQTETTLRYAFDVNDGLFSILASQSPINFYNDIYTPVCSAPNSTYCRPNYNCCNASDSNKCGITQPPNTAITAVSAATLHIEQHHACSGPGEEIPRTPSTLNVQIFGTASTAAVSEMTNSLNYCKKIFLGSPQYIENYIRVSYDSNIANIKAYLRADSSNKLCMPELRQVFQDGKFDTQFIQASKTWNNTNCTLLIDSTVLSLLPSATRNFVIEWIYQRTLRYARYINIKNGFIQQAAARAALQSAREAARAPVVDTQAEERPGLLNSYREANPLFESSAEAAALRAATTDDAMRANVVAADRLASSTLARLSPILAPVDLTSSALLNSIAQQFYELLGGQFAMTLIYDICPIGQTILDIRFQLRIHTDPTVAYGPIADLKAQYTRFRQSGKNTFNEDILNQAEMDYQNKLQGLEQSAINNVSNLFEGAVARIFYTPGTPFISLTGIIFDDRAVTSFIPALNGGLRLPNGSIQGNVNFVPTIEYTKNVTMDTLTCSDLNTVRRVMDDYTNDVQLHKNILLNAPNPIDTSLGTLFVNQVNSYTQISPTQCAYEWTESVYNPVTNLPIAFTSTGVNAGSQAGSQPTVFRRFGIFTYKADTIGWESPDLYYDPSGLKLLTSGTIPACSFDPATYRASVGQRFNSLGTSTSDINTIKTDFIRNSFKNGATPICPQTIPGYLFNPAVYLSVNTDVATALVDGLVHYKSNGIFEGRPVKSSTTTTPFTSPITYTKPLPSQTALDNNSGLCPTTYCDDLDVLYTLADQYNSKPDLPGFIMRIKRAFTPNPYQCDIEADVNYDATIQDIIGQKILNPTTGLPYINYPMIKKGTATYNVGSDKRTVIEGSKPVTATGIQTVKLALSVSLDKTTCNPMLVDAEGIGSGTSIQDNTPSLYKYMEYIDRMSQKGSSIGSSIAQIQSDFSSISGSVRAAAFNYRVNTYSAIGDINPISTCPGKKCSDSAVMNSIRTMIQGDLMTILNIGTGADGKSCDVTYTNRSSQTVAQRFTMSLTGTTCTPSSSVPIVPTPTYSDVQNMAVPLNTANTYKGSGAHLVSAFTDFVEPQTDENGALKPRSFGLDRARNSVDDYTDIQFQEPLKQVIPKKEVEDSTTYRFIRFVPLKTRSPDADSVGVSKFTFFYDGKPLALEGKVTNPMGTWEGEFKDIMGPGFRQGWSDAHKKPVVFAFKGPVLIDAYSFTTAAESIGSDPVAWKLEGSMNGSFWTLLDAQQRFPTPVERFHEIQSQAF